MSGTRWVRSALLVGVTTGLIAATATSVNAAEWNDWAKRPWSKSLWGNRPSNEAPKIMKTTIEDVMKNPGSFVGRGVSFECLFALQGNLFKPLNTRYNTANYVNFAVWQPGARLWEKAERRNVLPTMYIAKISDSVLHFLRDTDRYQKIRVSGYVTNAYAGLPWVLVTKMEFVDTSKDEQFSKKAIAHIRQGVMLEDKEQYTIAARHYYEAMTAGVPNVHKPFMYDSMGWAYFKAGQTNKGYHYLNHATHLKPDDAKVFIRLAKVQIKMENGHDAILSCDKALALSAEYPEAHAIMGEAYGQMGKIRQGLEHCNIAINSPAISARNKAMAEVRRARIYVQGKQLTDAIGAYAKALDDDNLMAEPWLRMEVGSIYEKEYDRTSKVQFLDEAISLYDSANALNRSVDAKGLYQQARAEFKKAMAADKNFSRVKELIKASLMANPRYAPAKLLQKRLDKLDGKVPATELDSSFKDIMKDAGENVETILELGAIYDDMGQTELARKTFGNALHFAENDRRVLSAYASAAEKSGDLVGAYAAVTKALAKTPRDAALLTQAGRIALASGNRENAHANLTEALRQEPNNTEAQTLMAKVMVLMQPAPIPATPAPKVEAAAVPSVNDVADTADEMHVAPVAHNETRVSEANLAEIIREFETGLDETGETAIEAPAVDTNAAPSDEGAYNEAPVEPLPSAPSTDATIDLPLAVEIDIPGIMEPIAPEELSPLRGSTIAPQKNQVRNAAAPVHVELVPAQPERPVYARSEVIIETPANVVNNDDIAPLTEAVTVPRNMPVDMVPAKTTHDEKEKQPASKAITVDDLPDWAK